MKARIVYPRPVIVSNPSGLTSRFSSRPHATLRDIDGVSVEGMLAEHGSPLFVFSERILRDNHRSLRALFANGYPRVRLAWPYGTAANTAICRVLARAGASIGVASPFEYEQALRGGVMPGSIHYHASPWPNEALMHAAVSGATLRVDDFATLARFESLVTDTDPRPSVSLHVRACFGTENIDERARVLELVRRILQKDRLRLSGLHARVEGPDPEAHGNAAAQLADIANALRAQHGLLLDFIEIGSDLGSVNPRRADLRFHTQSSPSMARFATAIAHGLEVLDCPPAQCPTLLLEAGRRLVETAGYLITTVQSAQQLPDGRRALFLDAGANLLVTSRQREHPIATTRELPGLAAPTVLHAASCMSSSLHDALSLPPLAAGEPLLFCHVGAHNLTHWTQAHAPRPAVVMVGPHDECAIIRRAERSVDLNAFENIPGWLS